MDARKKYLEIVKTVASFSVHPTFKVGAIIVNRFGRTISSGVNVEGYYHAEVGAIFPVLDYDEKTFKIPEECIMYITAPPCERCAELIVSARIMGVVCLQESKSFLERWGSSCKKGRKLLRSQGIIYNLVDR